MAEQRFGGGALDYLAEALSRGEDKGGGITGVLQGPGTPVGGGMNQMMGGLLKMLGEARPPQPEFNIVNGSAAVDKMLSGGDPSRRFWVYRRKMNSDEAGNAENASGSIAQWLLISDDGKEGFGLNTNGEQLEIPKSLEGYERHPKFKNSYTAAGLNRARQLRQKQNDEVNAVIRDNAWRSPVLQEAPDPDDYFLGLNDCQRYIKELDRLYKE